MRKRPIGVILSGAKDLVLLASYEDEIPRRGLGMTVVTQSAKGGGSERLSVRLSWSGS